MKKVILLSCSTGQGHDSCAKAIQEYFELQGVHCDIRDSLEFISPKFASFMSKGHSFMYRKVPRLFRWGYGYGESHPKAFERNSKIYRILNTGGPRLYQALSRGGYDVVICTHVLSAIMVTQIKKRFHLSIKTAFVATDHTWYPGIHTSDLDWYFVSSPGQEEEYMKRGIEKEKIVLSGIPVRRKFFEEKNPQEARKRLGIGRKSRHLVIMGGSMGCGPIEKLVGQLARKWDRRMEISVICGRNKSLYRKLSHRHRNHSGIHIVGFTEEMPLYLDSADLYFTKPGGISVTEGAAKAVPMVYVNAVAGCEEYNMNFFLKNGGAVTGKSVRELSDLCVDLLFSDERLDRMRKVLESCGKLDGAANVYRVLSMEE